MLFERIANNKHKNYLFITVLALIFTSISVSMIWTDEDSYSKTIAKITSIAEKESLKNEDNDQATIQQVQAVVLNGTYKGKEVRLENSTSHSHALDLNLKVNDEIFITIKDVHNNIINAQLIDLKRDRYIAYMVGLFVALIIIIGGMKGLRSLVSLLINLGIILITLKLYLNGSNLILVTTLASFLIIMVSIPLVSGINKKSVSAVAATMIGTFVSVLIAAGVIFITNSKGIHYEEMEFLTAPPEQIFIAEILIGTIGAIMDIAISISASIQEMYNNNPDIGKTVLMNSGMEIGTDIMGTMANTLVFAYISGSIPMVILWLVNGFSIFYIIRVNISLEIIRALAGSIGIVISIPITLLISIMLLKSKKIGEIIND